jgi:Beta-propeller repeat/Bacterial Ig domain
MLRQPRLYSSLALAIFSSLVAGLITYRHLSTQAKSLVGDRQQDATFMSLVSSGSNPAEAQEQNRLRIEVGYGNLPLSFEPNQGQTDPRVKFVSHAGNHTLWLTSDEAVLAVGGQSGANPSNQKGKEKSLRANESAPAVLRVKFVGANTSPTIEGEARQPGTVNYFGGKPEQWRTKIPIYGRVRYGSLYPGIDLVFYGSNRELEYDLVIAPGADPGRIKLAMAGADEIRIDADGNLVLRTSQGDVVQQKPKIYQRKGATLKPVTGEYVLNGKNEVGFRLGSYDPRAAVVIDPVLRYSSFLGGDGTDTGNAIAVDSSNRAVVVGTDCSSNFPVTAGHTLPKPCSAFITKFDFTGSHLLFSTLLGDDAFGEGVALDSSGNIYVTGQTLANFPTTPGALQTTFGGDNDAFVTKLGSTGSKLLYSTFLGGSAADHGMGIVVDREGDAYVAGFTASKNFPVTSGVFQNECRLTSDGVCSSAFVTKLNSTGSRALYSTFLGGHGSQIANGIAIDLAGHAFVTGSTTASDFPTIAGTAQPVFGGDTDGFVAELSSSGSHLNYSTFLGGGNLDQGEAIALDSLGNAYVAGMTRSLDFPVRNAFQPHCATVNGICSNPVVTKLSSSGRLLYSTYLGSEGSATGIAVTPGGQALIAGFTASESFPTTSNVFQRVFAGGNEVFLVKFSPTGKFIYGSYLGGNGFDVQPSIALDRDTNVYLTGTTSELNPATPSSFPVTPGAFQEHPSGGSGDAFVAKVVGLCALNSANRTVTLCAPSNGSTVKSPVNIVAGTTDITPVKLTQVYLDGKKIYETPLSAINVGLPIPAGTHRLTVQGLDTASVFFKKSISINVSPH